MRQQIGEKQRGFTEICREGKLRMGYWANTDGTKKTFTLQKSTLVPVRDIQGKVKMNDEGTGLVREWHNDTLKLYPEEIHKLVDIAEKTLGYIYEAEQKVQAETIGVVLVEDAE